MKIFTNTKHCSIDHVSKYILWCENTWGWMMWWMSKLSGQNNIFIQWYYTGPPHSTSASPNCLWNKCVLFLIQQLLHLFSPAFPGAFGGTSEADSHSNHTCKWSLVGCSNQSLLLIWGLCVCFWLLSVLYINSLSGTQFPSIVYHSMGCLSSIQSVSLVLVFVALNWRVTLSVLA